jgi:5-formyltetrahydrofolate cyclo-ligase
MRTSIAEQKSSIREHHHAIRRSLRLKEWKKMSAQIVKRTMATKEFKSTNTIHTYVSMEKNREVNTIDIINTCIARGKEVIVPRMKSEGELTHHKITSIDKLIRNKWGVYEPPGDDEVELSDGILVVVPMVAADFKCNRLGYGKGYYDRFLAGINATKIGLCFNGNLSWDPLPVGTFDIKMDKIITNQFDL